MTSINAHESTADPPRSEGRRRKSVLYCPVCGHESPVDGDWTVQTTECQQEYQCPECDHAVALR